VMSVCLRQDCLNFWPCFKGQLKERCIFACFEYLVLSLAHANVFIEVSNASSVECSDTADLSGQAVKTMYKFGFLNRYATASNRMERNTLTKVWAGFSCLKVVSGSLL
jgi:hypothetical protein